MDRRQFLAAFVAVAASAGCATVGDARSERGTGVIVSYAAPFDQVWPQVAATLRELDLQIAADNMAEGYVLAESSASAFSWGERVAVFVERIGTQGNTRVEVVSKRAIGINFTASDWAPKIHERLGQRFRRL